MTKSQDERLQRVALLAGREESRVGWRTGEVNRSRDLYRRWTDRSSSGTPPSGFVDTGLGWSREAARIRPLIESGLVSQEDASEYIRMRYPAHALSSGRFEDEASLDRAREMIDAGALAGNDPARAETENRIRSDIAGQGLQGRGDSVGRGEGVAISPGVDVPQVGEDYSADDVLRCIGSVASQLSEQIDDVRRGNSYNPVNSIDGASIRPGTITPEKVDQESFNKAVRDLPGPEETVRLELCRQEDVDNDAIDGETVGAKRVWKVAKMVYPPNYAPRPGPTRIQVVSKGMKFNCMSIDGRAKSITVRYGLIIKGITHTLGRVPQSILYAVSSGYSPGQVNAVHDGSTSNVGPDSVDYNPFNPAGMYDETRGTEDFVTNPPLWLERHGENVNLYPSASDVSMTEGVKFMLVTGTTAKEVYAQLNSKQVNGAYIGGNAQGPTASLPPGRIMESPAPACASTQNGTGNTLNGETRAGATESDKWRIAYPLSYNVCSQLVATDKTFSVVVMPDLAHEDSGVSTVSFSIDDMSSNGVTVIRDVDREVGVDIVVV